MAIILNKAGYDRAVAILKKGLEIEHDMRNWHEVKPTPDEIARFLDTHTLDEYGSWFLGINTDADQKDKSKFDYPFGDLQVLHKSALIAAEKIATIKHHEDIKKAVHDLLEMLKQTKK